MQDLEESLERDSLDEYQVSDLLRYEWQTLAKYASKLK